MSDKDTIIKGCEYWIKNHKEEPLLLKYTAIEKLLFVLKEQNTRRNGKWRSVPHKKARICSICETDEPYKFADNDADVYAYCPHCGAKMEE